MQIAGKRRGKPDVGPVFLNRRGPPYAAMSRIGGNPLSKARETARRNTAVGGFRIRTAVTASRSGSSRTMETCARCPIAGWSSMRVVQRHAVFEKSGLDDLMNRTV